MTNLDKISDLFCEVTVYKIDLNKNMKTLQEGGANSNHESPLTY